MGIRLLGAVLVDGDAALEPRDRLALGVLAVRRGQVVAPEQLADALWPEVPPQSWRKQVQILIGRLRKALGPEAIETVAGGYRLVLPDDDVDAGRFEALVGKARALAATGEADRAAVVLARALELWRGRAFEDLDAWPPARTEADRLDELRRTAEEDRLEAQLLAGEHSAAAAAAEVLVAQEPLRERRWAALALARYRCGRQADALDALRQARRLLVEQLGVEPSPDLAALEQAVLRQDPTLDGVAEPGTASDVCPYKGLAPYQPADADAFFGRDAEVARCLGRLATSPVLVVAGPSGSGKSSLVRAGLVPVLRRRGRDVVVVPSGADLDGDQTWPSGAAVVVDQYEDLLVAADGAAVRRAGARLAAHASGGGIVVMTVRSDAVAALSADVGMRRLAERGLHLVSPLSGEDLRTAVEGPARAAGLRLQAGLVELLVRDCEGEPGALPLLSHALVETWRRRDGRVLTVDGYRASGGIRAAVARSADRLHDSLPTEQRTVLRSVLLRLVTPSPDGEPVRCRVPARSLLSGTGHERVVRLLVTARLVTAEEDTFELAHEALARAWPRLRSWLDDDAAGIRLLRHLTAAAEGWESLGRAETELYRGARLDAALEWVAESHPVLTEAEHAFLDASSERSASEARALAARARLEAVRNRRLRLALATTVVFLVTALVAGTLAVQRSSEARDQRDTAQAAGTRARLEALVGRSLALRSTDRAAAALLAVEAYRRSPDASARSALLSTFTAAPSFLGYRRLPARRIAGAAVPGTSTAAVVLDGTELAVLDLDTGSLSRRRAVLDAEPAGRASVRVSGDGRAVAVVVPIDGCSPGCAVLSVHDLASGRLLGPSQQVPDGDLALSADGRWAAVAGDEDGRVEVRRVADGELVASLPPEPVTRPEEHLAPPAAAVAFGAAQELYVSSSGRLRVLDPTRPDGARTMTLPPVSAGQHLLVAGDVILIGGPDGILAVDPTTGAVAWTADLRDGLHPDPCPWLTVDTGAGRFFCGSYYGVVQERDLATGERTGTVLDPQLGGVGDMDVAEGGRLVAFGAEQPVVSSWRLDGSGLANRLVAEAHVAAEGYDPTGRSMLVARRPPDATTGSDLTDFALWDVDADASTAVLRDVEGVGWAGSGTLVGLDRGTGQIRFWDGAVRPLPGVEVPLTAFHQWSSAGGALLFAGFEDGTVWTIDVATRRRTGPTLHVVGPPASVSATEGGERIVVTAWGPDGPQTTVHDGSTGEVVAGPVGELTLSSVSLAGRLAGATFGAVRRYDLDDLSEVATLSGARGEVNSLQWSTDGSVLLATSNDQTVSVYDADSGTRLGDPLPAASPFIYPGSLRPDGGAVAVTGRRGVYVWDLDASRLAAAACRLAGRNLTATEWTTYLAELGPRRATCPEHPL
jgi:DNA-binding SARP family transcriptional activator/WD40 repeat protein